MDELKNKAFSAVIVGRPDHDLLADVIGTSVAEAVRRHTEDADVWVVDIEEDTEEA